ncbi:Predicted flavoproteins [Enterobacter sp. CC120223-11]|nr:Predicted flavoproteins [Enterobacter sp. CC120223-11]
MNILNTIAGVLGGNEGDTTSYQAILSWVNEQGGVNTLLDKFHKEGIGEVMDVTGWLSGYNFQWAWASTWAWACAQALTEM